MPWMGGRIEIDVTEKDTPEQIVDKLQETDRLLAEGQDVAGLCRALQVTEATYYRWRNQYGGLKAEDAKRLKELVNRPGWDGGFQSWAG